MLDFAWSELILVLVVAVLVLGPKQIPEILYVCGKLVRRAQYIRYAITQQVDDILSTRELTKGHPPSAPLAPPDNSERDDDDAYHNALPPENKPPGGAP